MKQEAVSMQFGMPTLIENDTVEQNAALCRQFGLDFVELNTNLPICQLEHGTTSLRRIAEQYGIAFFEQPDKLAFADEKPSIFTRTCISPISTNGCHWLIWIP